MSGTETLVAIGGLTVAADSPDVNALFQSVAASVNALPNADKFTYDGGTIPAASSDGHSVLLLPASVTATVAVPDGYAYVVAAQGSHATITAVGDAGPNPPPVVVGDGFNFQGKASVVASGGGVSNISQTATYGDGLIRAAGTATLNYAIGYGHGDIVASSNSHTTITATGSTHNTYAVTVESGATSTATIGLTSLLIQDGATTKVTLVGGGNRVQIGTFAGAPPTPPAPAPVPPPAPKPPGSHAASAPVVFTNTITTDPLGGSSFFGSNTYGINDATSVNLISLGENDAVNATAGASTMFGASGDSVSVSGAATLFFVGGSGASTIHGDNTVNFSGNSPGVTLFATSAALFDVGSSQQNVFVGGVAASTINAGGGGGSFFGGSHGDLYNSGTSAQYGNQVFVGTGGADTINGAAGSVAPVIYAERGEKMTLTGTVASTVVAFTDGGQVDASRTVADNTFFAGYGGSGNETLVGSTASFDPLGNALHDIFVVGSNPNPLFVNPLTITVENWHGGDVLYLSGFPSFDAQDAAGSISRNAGSGHDLSLMLSDNTTITFVGNHPTNVTGNALS